MDTGKVNLGSGGNYSFVVSHTADMRNSFETSSSHALCRGSVLSSGDSTPTLFLLILACSNTASVISPMSHIFSVFRHCVASLHPHFFLLKCHSPFVLSYFLVSCAASVLSSNVSFSLVSLCVFYFLVFYADFFMFDYPLGHSHYYVMFALTSVMWCFPFNSNL